MLEQQLVQRLHYNVVYTLTAVSSPTVSPLYKAIIWSCDMTKTLTDDVSGAAIDAQLLKALRQTSDSKRQTW
eukprot:12657-Heterococcus_DN1.PRE.4